MIETFKQLPIVACSVHEPVLRRSLEDDCEFDDQMRAQLDESVHCPDCLFLVALVTGDSSPLLGEVGTTGKKSFSRRLRELLAENGLTQEQIAKKAELEQSIVSRLASESDESRLEPRLEHVFSIARAFGLQPRELVEETSAEALLDDWVPRSEFEMEAKARAAAQTETATMRTELAGAKKEVDDLRSEVEQLATMRAELAGAKKEVDDLRSEVEQLSGRFHDSDRRLSDATKRIAALDASLRKERTARGVVVAKLASAIQERDRALGKAQHNYEAWANLHSHHQKVLRELSASRTNSWIKALLGGVVGVSAMVAAGTVAAGTKKNNKRQHRQE